MWDNKNTMEARFEALEKRLTALESQMGAKGDTKEIYKDIMALDRAVVKLKYRVDGLGVTESPEPPSKYDEELLAWRDRGWKEPVAGSLEDGAKLVGKRKEAEAERDKLREIVSRAGAALHPNSDAPADGAGA